MADIRITNCHTHTFTTAHVPVNFPHQALRPFKRLPWLVRQLARFMRLLGRYPAAEALDRLHQFQEEGGRARQADILASMRRQYPRSTRFVVLPMDMAPIGHGRVAVDIEAQHDELYEMWRDPAHRSIVLPFATIHPDREGAAEEVERCLDKLRFRGLKIYPRLGFPPDHPVLMERVYPMLVERDLPVMTHCSRGGVRGKFVSQHRAERYTDPRAYLRVLAQFPTLRICLAHFGGSADWRSYVEDGRDPEAPDTYEDNWQVLIRRLIGSGDYPGLWTDISYTLFRFEDNVPFLKIFLAGDDEPARRLRRRVLFGSDFYMTRQETLSERAVCIRLRTELGEETFRRMAETNPEVWLGERAPDPADKSLWNL